MPDEQVVATEQTEGSGIEEKDIGVLQDTLKAAAEAAAVQDPTIPSDEKIAEWKKTYGKIHVTDILGISFIFRGLGIKEYDTIMRMAGIEAQNPKSTYSPDGDVVEKCVLWPYEPPDLRGREGVISTLSNVITEWSGFINNPPVIEL